jgi:hypothetical protein
MRYTVEATVNYPETETDTPNQFYTSKHELIQWLGKLLDEPNAVSFVITIVRQKGIKV